MLKLSRIFREDENQTAANVKIGFSRATAIKDFVFAVIEGSIVIGALQFAFEKSQSPIVLALYATSFLVLCLYIVSGGTFIRFLILENWSFAKRHRTKFLRISLFLGFFFSFITVKAISYLTKEVIANSIMI